MEGVCWVHHRGEENERRVVGAIRAIDFQVNGEIWGIG